MKTAIKLVSAFAVMTLGPVVFFLAMGYEGWLQFSPLVSYFKWTFIFVLWNAAVVAVPRIRKYVLCRSKAYLALISITATLSSTLAVAVTLPIAYMFPHILFLSWGTGIFILLTVFSDVNLKHGIVSTKNVIINRYFIIPVWFLGNIIVLFLVIAVPALLKVPGKIYTVKKIASNVTHYEAKDNMYIYSNIDKFDPEQANEWFEGKTKPPMHGPVCDYNIIREEKRGNVELILSTASVTSGEIEPYYWIYYSDDSGKNWLQCFTGIIARRPYFIKDSSNIPMLDETGENINLEAMLLNVESEMILPVMLAKYSEREDSLLITFPVQELVQDSDNDGITDYFEKMLCLNAYDKDTDGDGIEDSEDHNPKFKSSKNELSMLYEAVDFVRSDTLYLSDYISHRDEYIARRDSAILVDTLVFGDLRPVTSIPSFEVSLDPSMNGMYAGFDYCIILSPVEYLSNYEFYKNETAHTYFPYGYYYFDDWEERFSEMGSGVTYRIIRMNGDWAIHCVSSYII